PVPTFLGPVVQFEGKTTAGTLTAGGTDRYLFALQPSELQSTASGTVYLGVQVRAATGSAFKAGLPTLARLTPVLTRTTADGAYAIFALSHAGLEQINVSGANGNTSGAYTLQLSVLGDVNDDGNVDGVDASLLTAAVGSSGGPADLNRDGTT